LDSGFHAGNSGFQVLDLLGFRIPIIGGILDSWSCIPDFTINFQIPESGSPNVGHSKINGNKPSRELLVTSCIRRYTKPRDNDLAYSLLT